MNADPPQDVAAHALQWADSTGRIWRVDLSPGHVVFTSGDDVVDLPSDAWKRDLYAAAHAGGFIIRVDRFDGQLGFLVPAPAALPFLRHLGTAPRQEQPTDQPDHEPARPGPSVWPKVSPLAVWALMTSSLVFLPALGIVTAAVTTFLLIRHRKTVRRSIAWNHSRALCKAAFCLLMLGLPVNALASWSLLVNNGILERYHTAQSFEESARLCIGNPIPSHANALESQDRPQAQSGTPLVAQSADPDAGLPFWQREHNWGLIAAGLVVVLLSLTVHEAAHAITAWWMGDDLAHRLGRVTLNPIAQIDPIGTVVLPLILFMMNSTVWGWAKPVPVELHNVPNPRRAQILVSLAGPASNLLLAAASLMLLLGLGGLIGFLFPSAYVANFCSPHMTETVEAQGFPGAAMFGPLCIVLKLTFLVNTALACFNLIPLPPLDGSWVLQYSFPRTLGPLYERIRPYSPLVFLLFMYSGVIHYLLLPALALLIPGFWLFCNATPL